MTETQGAIEFDGHMGKRPGTPPEPMSAETGGQIHYILASMATQDAGSATQAGARGAPPPPRRSMGRIGGHVDPSILRKAREIIDSIDPNDEFDTPLYLNALAGTIMELWETAANSDATYQDVLATFEAGVRQLAESGSVTEGQLRVFREALSDLSQTKLVVEHAEVIRSQFVRENFRPLGFANDEDSGLNDDEGNTRRE